MTIDKMFAPTSSGAKLILCYSERILITIDFTFNPFPHFVVTIIHRF